MKKPKTKKRKPTLAQRERMMRQAIRKAFDGVTSRAHFKHLADELMGEALTGLSMSEGKSEDAHPTIMWSDDPIMGLAATVEAYSEFTKIPLDELCAHTISRIPQIKMDFGWN